MKLVILLPAYNEATVIGSVIQGMPREILGCTSVQTIVVDDGSRDATSNVAREAGAEVLRHRFNRGAGLARITGMKAAWRLGADLLVSMDSDGQHDPADIARVIAPLIRQEADIVIGTRLINPRGMPLVRQVGNRIMNNLVRVFSGAETSDSQSGFVAYNRQALTKLKLISSGHEFCTEMLVRARQAGLVIRDVPIRVIYTDYSRRKGQSVINGMNVLLQLVFQKLTRP